MKRFVLDTIASRTLLVVVLALLISHALSTAFYITERKNALDLVAGEHVLERIITLTQFIDNAPADERRRLIPLVNESALPTTLTAAPSLPAKDAGGWQERLLHESLREHLARHGSRVFRLRLADTMPVTARGGDGGHSDPPPATLRMLHVSLKLTDGSWVNFEALLPQAESIWSFRFILSIAVLTILMIAVSMIIIHRINVPLRRFARAAERFGTNVDAPPLPVEGPREIRQVTAAFNDMQQRIRRLIEDRRQILAAVSHDLRTPITLIRLRAEHIDDKTERTKILAALDDIETMVASILEFARQDAASEEVRKVDVAALVRSLCDDMADLGRPVTFEGPDRLTSECRPVSLRRAVGNLVDNAIRYGRRARVELSGNIEGITLTIDDDGPGIPEPEMKSVFTPFYRLDRSRSRHSGGVGLGMTVARQVIVLHGGDIALVNRKQGGLRVIVTLPYPADAFRQ